MEYRDLGQQRSAPVGRGFRAVDAQHRLVGRVHRRRGGRAAARGARAAASTSSTRRTATATAAPRSSSARRSATTRTSSSRRKSATTSTPTRDERRGQREIPQDFSPAYIRRACDESLRRLRRDRIDFYQLHNPKMDTIERDETFACLDDLVREGKIASYGVALGPAIGWEAEGVKAARERNIAGDADHLQHAGAGSRPRAHRRVPRGAARASSRACRTAPACSKATTPIDTQFAENDHRRHRPRAWLIDGLKKVEQLQFLLDARPGATLGQIALQWILSDPAVASTLPNIYNREQLAEFAAASDSRAADRRRTGARAGAVRHELRARTQSFENAQGAGRRGSHDDDDDQPRAAWTTSTSAC